MKTVDIIFLFAVFLLFIFLLTSYLFNNFVIGLLISIAVGLLGFLSYKSLNKDGKRQKKSSFFASILLYGKDYSNKLISFLIPTEKFIIQKEGYLIIDGERKILVFNNIKYGNVNEEDISKIFRINLVENCHKVILFCRDIDKKALTLFASLPFEYQVVNLKNLYRLCEKKGLVPQEKVLVKTKPNLKVFIKNSFSVKSMRYFLFSALSLSLLSLITPLKTYYLIFSGINLVLCILSLVISRKGKIKDNLFEN